MALEEIKGYLVKCDKCGAYLGDETDLVLDMDDIEQECEINDWDIIEYSICKENGNIIIGNNHYCTNCKNNNK